MGLSPIVMGNIELSHGHYAFRKSEWIRVNMAMDQYLLIPFLVG